MKYILVGGNPIRSYTGTTTFTGLYVLGSSDDKDEIIKMYERNYEDCSGLLLIIDTETNDAASLASNKIGAEIWGKRFQEMNLDRQIRKWILEQIDQNTDLLTDDYKLACGQSWDAVADDLAEIMGLDGPDMTDGSEFRKIWDSFFCE